MSHRLDGNAMSCRRRGDEDDVPMTLLYARGVDKPPLKVPVLPGGYPIERSQEQALRDEMHQHRKIASLETIGRIRWVEEEDVQEKGVGGGK